MRTLPALLVLAVTGTTAGADTAVMRPPPAGAERIMDAKQVMRLAAIVRSTGYACQEGIFVAYKLPREADAQRFDVMCLGTGALSDRRMRHYMLQIQDDASLALEWGGRAVEGRDPPAAAQAVVGEKDQAGSGPDAARETAERHALERAHGLD